MKKFLGKSLRGRRSSGYFEVMILFSIRKPNRYLLSVFFILFAPISGVADVEVPDPGIWYAEQYAPLWRDEPWTKADEVLTFYHSEIQVHEPGGEIVTHETAVWMREILAGWEAEGWLGSQVPDIRVERINHSTASFTTRWLDHYKDAEDDYSCGWYLADLIDGQWKFTQYAEVDCASRDWGECQTPE